MIRNHLTNKIDNRYTVALEFCGYPERLYVARWEQYWIGQSLNEAEAWELAQEHYDEHKIDEVYPKTVV